jgi:Cu(I)/Ag(I) efflux system membrane fusion protein
MFANIEVQPAQRKQVLVVPSEAVIATGTRTVLILAEPGGKFRPVEVATGAESDGETEVLSGVGAGQRVVASGQFLIDSEASLRGALRRLEGAPQGADKARPAPPATHGSQGRIEQIGREQVTISHEPIPSLHWGPMTMPFALPPGGLPAGLKVGDRVAFDITKLPDGRYQIVSMRPGRAVRQHDGDHQ